MAGEAPVLPMQLGLRRIGDFGFDPEVEYLQILEEARRSGRVDKSSPESLRFVLRKPVSDDDPEWRSKGKKRRRWWRNPLLFLRKRRSVKPAPATRCPAAAPYSRPRQSLSGPVYLTESGAGASSTPCRRSAYSGRGKPSSGPLRFSEMRDMEIPYLCLRDAAAMASSPPALPSSPAMPIYLVT